MNAKHLIHFHLNLIKTKSRVINDKKIKKEENFEKYSNKT